MKKFVYILQSENTIVGVYEREDVAKSIKKHITLELGKEITIVKELVNPEISLAKRKLNG